MALVGAAGLNGRDALIGPNYGIVQVGFSVDDGVTVKLAGPAGDIGEGPGPEGGKDQVLSDTGFPLRGSLHELDFLCDPLADGKDTGNIDLQKHGVGTVTDFLVNVEGLRIHVTDDLVFSLESEEITEGGLEGLEVAVIKFNASFPQDEEGVFLRDEIAQLFIGEVADARDKKLREVSIDVPALFQVLIGQLRFIGGFSGTLFAEDEVELIGVEVFPSSTVEDEASRQEAQEEIEEHELDQREPSCLKYSIAIKQ